MRGAFAKKEHESNVGVNMPLKINMKPKNHPIEKENHLPNLDYWVPCFLYQAVNSYGLLIP